MILDPTTQSSSKIHRADLAGRSWDVLRNSWGTERSYLQRETKPKLRSAAWLQSAAARKLVAMGGLDLDKLFEEAQSKDFKPVDLPMRSQARSQPSAPVRREKCTCGIAFQGSAAAEAVLYTAQYDHLGVDLIGMATTFLTARLIMRLAAPCSWS